MNVLESCLLVQLALLVGQPEPGPRVLLDTAEPIALRITQPAPVPRVLLDTAEPLARQLDARPTSSAAPGDQLPADFPRKIWVQPVLRETVSRMWTTSPTFRRQCLQVEASGAVQVQLRVDPSLATNPERRATCELRIYTNGGIIARVYVAPLRLPELIGHEFEHVCERLEGVKVEEEERLQAAGFYRIGSGVPRYETDRAIRVGRQVMAEMNIAGSLTRTQ